MQLASQPEVTEYEELEYGSIFMSIFAERYALRAIKAFVENDDGERTDWFVIVGPFTDRDEGVPGAHKAEAFSHPVLDLTQIVQFSPSVSPDDILPELPPRRSCSGVAFLMSERALLGVRCFDRGGWGEPAYLDLLTGEITFKINHDRLIVSRRWSFVDHEDKTRVLYAYELPEGAAG